MPLARRELRRRPGRFAIATVVLTFLSVLLLLLGGLLDGLYLGSTGALRAQRADVIVFSDGARDSILRSRITPDVRATVEALPEVAEVGGLGVALLGAQRAEAGAAVGEIVDVAVAGYELAPRGVPDPAGPGRGWVDDRVRDEGVRAGDTLLVGPAATPIVVEGFVSDTSYLLQAGVWVDLATWREVVRANRPDVAAAEGVVQVLAVRATDGTSTGDLAAAIDAATAGATSTLSRGDAVEALPGIREQRSTFGAIIGSTIAVVVVVVGLFFSLLTLERTPLFGVLKAIGASTGTLFRGVVAQAVAVAVVAFVVGAAAALGLAAVLPATVPLQLTAGRFAFTFVALVAAAVLGSAVSLRRVTRIDPASAIGSTK